MKNVIRFEGPVPQVTISGTDKTSRPGFGRSDDQARNRADALTAIKILVDALDGDPSEQRSALNRARVFLETCVGEFSRCITR